jgi:hypothetical protein
MIMRCVVTTGFLALAVSAPILLAPALSVAQTAPAPSGPAGTPTADPRAPGSSAAPGGGTAPGAPSQGGGASGGTGGSSSGTGGGGGGGGGGGSGG